MISYLFKLNTNIIHEYYPDSCTYRYIPTTYIGHRYRFVTNTEIPYEYERDIGVYNITWYFKIIIIFLLSIYAPS